MALEETGRKLREMYDTAPDEEKARQGFLFGVEYADDLHGLSNRAILKLDIAFGPRCL